MSNALGHLVARNAEFTFEFFSLSAGCISFVSPLGDLAEELVGRSRQLVEANALSGQLGIGPGGIGPSRVWETQKKANKNTMAHTREDLQGCKRPLYANAVRLEMLD